MDFKKRLARAMEVRECTRAALAKELGVSPQAVGMVLSGDTRALTAENAAKAARFLRVDYYWLATGEGDMEPQLSWPFPRVPIERFIALKEPDRAYVEGRLEQAIETREMATMSVDEQQRSKRVLRPAKGPAKKSRPGVKKAP